jgi:hypothetical protein
VSDWKIEATKAKAEDITTHDVLVSFLASSAAWKRLSKPARAAVEAAYPDGEVRAHPNTIKALARHGFIDMPKQHIPFGYQTEAFGFLTEAGKAVVRWCVRGEVA